VKRKEYEVYHPLQSSAKVKNVWNYTLASSYAFIEWRVIKHRGSCIIQVLYSKVSCNALLRAMNYLAIKTGFNVSGSLNRNVAQFCVAASNSEINIAFALYFFTEHRISSAAFPLRFILLHFLFTFLLFVYMSFGLLLLFFFCLQLSKSSAYILLMVWLCSFSLLTEIFLLGQTLGRGNNICTKNNTYSDLLFLLVSTFNSSYLYVILLSVLIG
jgi:hypothetical protein